MFGLAARRSRWLNLSGAVEEPSITQHDSPGDAPGTERTELSLRTTDLAKVRATLWAAADELRANSKLTPVQYRDPVLGLVFLAYAENRFEAIREDVESRASARNPATVADYKAKSVLYVPDESRLSYLVGLPEGDDIGKAVDEAIKAIEATNPELRDILPRGYQKLERPTLIELLRLFAPLPTQLEGDAFGFIYEDFLSNFAAQEGKGGGEYFTPYSIVRLIVEILEPFRGRVFETSRAEWIHFRGGYALAA